MNNKFIVRDNIKEALAPLHLGQLEAPPDKAALTIRGYLGLEELRITVAENPGYRTQSISPDAPLRCHVWFVDRPKNKSIEISRMDPLLKDTLASWLREVMAVAVPYWKRERMYVDTFSSFKPDDNVEELSRRSVNDAPVEDLELTVRSYNALKRASINTIGELVARTEDEMMAIRNLGQRSLSEIKTCLAARGQTLRASE